VKRVRLFIFSILTFSMITTLIGCIRPITSDSIRDFFYPHRLENGFINVENKGCYQMFDKENDGWGLAFCFARLDRSTHHGSLINRWYGAIGVDMPLEDTVDFIIRKCSIDISYDSAAHKIRNILYLINKGHNIYPKQLPRHIDSTLFASITKSDEDYEVYQGYGSIEHVPSNILKQDEYGNFNMYVIYYDFPEETNAITYHLDFEGYKGNKLLKVDTTFNLHKISVEAKTRFD